MARKKPDELGRTYCPSCGQAIRSSVTKTGALLQKAADKKGLSQAAVAREVGVANQTINMLFAGHQGNRSVYLGLRPRRRGDQPLVFKVAQIVGVREAELTKALLADQMLAARSGNACYLEHPSEQHESSLELVVAGRNRTHSAA